VIACMSLAPPNRGSLNSTHVYGTRVSVEEPSTASIPDMTVVKGGISQGLLTETRQFQFEDVNCPETQSALGGARTGLLQIWGVDRASGSEQAIGRKVRNTTETIWSFDI
jgi:hypothetical protein